MVEEQLEVDLTSAPNTSKPTGRRERRRRYSEVLKTSSHCSREESKQQRDTERQPDVNKAETEASLNAAQVLQEFREASGLRKIKSPFHEFMKSPPDKENFPV